MVANLFKGAVLICKTANEFLTIFVKLERGRKSSPACLSGTPEGTGLSAFGRVLISGAIFEWSGCGDRKALGLSGLIRFFENCSGQCKCLLCGAPGWGPGRGRFRQASRAG